MLHAQSRFLFIENDIAIDERPLAGLAPNAPRQLGGSRSQIHDQRTALGSGTQQVTVFFAFECSATCRDDTGFTQTFGEGGGFQRAESGFSFGCEYFRYSATGALHDEVIQ